MQSCFFFTSALVRFLSTIIVVVVFYRIKCNFELHFRRRFAERPCFIDFRMTILMKLWYSALMLLKHKGLLRGKG